jgi:hypothetical protein
MLIEVELAASLCPSKVELNIGLAEERLEGSEAVLVATGGR